MLIDEKALNAVADKFGGKVYLRDIIEAYEAAKSSEQPVGMSVIEKALENGAHILANFKPEGDRTKIEEWQACYALLFKQLNDAAQVIRRLQSDTERESGWQPIEAAPKDGSDILVWWTNTPIITYWLDNSKTTHPWEGWKLPSMVMVTGVPTHWMPLPTNPTGIEDQSNG